MIERFYPYEYVESVFAIDYEKLFADGYRGLLFDIDNTLVCHGDDSNKAVDNLFMRLHALGFRTVLLSDNSEKRILRFIKNIDTLYVAEAKKPSTEGYEKAVKMLDLPKEKVIMIGDQIFTDIYGANKSNIACILVQFLRKPEETKFGKRRAVERMILRLYRKNKKYTHRLGNIRTKAARPPKRKLFCEMNPVFYVISEKKEVLKRYIKNFSVKTHFAKKKDTTPYPVLVTRYSSGMIKTGPGIDPELQRNKADNIRIAAQTMNGLILRPGELFSFWKNVGILSRRKGYKEGRFIKNGKLIHGLGGGLCNLANTIHNLVIRSPLVVTEFHNHSDALAPDNGKRVPFSSGTSISYNIDYRFRNDTTQPFQLLVRCEGDTLFAELRSDREYPYYFDISEEAHRFVKEGEKYYRLSKIYKNTFDRKTDEIIKKELILDNRSEVMFDYDLIPKEQIKDC